MSDDLHSGPAIRNIAVATDFSAWSERALRHALAVARWFGAALHIFHIVRRTEFSLCRFSWSRSMSSQKRDYEDLIGRLKAAHSLDDIRYHFWKMDGEISDVAGSFVRDHRIDLMILGTRGRSGVSKFILGSVAQEIFITFLARC
jgi:nucleotide-binding universal stress UspA family protein